MTNTAPITQDVLTIPRKLPEGGKINLVGFYYIKNVYIYEKIMYSSSSRIAWEVYC